ncbi:MAG: sugar ABC transporter substrate-binding protein [Eubacteriales bacterium]|nr:sugar ABC transporter substrate-binding protein [Eubacteriales bacterium]
MMKKKSVSVSLASAMALAALLGGMNVNAADDAGITLEWQQWWAVECPEGYVQAICDRYYEETGVKVELLSAPFADTKTAIVSGASTGTVADIVSVDGSWVYDFADQGILTNISTLLDADGFDQSVFMSQWTAMGSTYALPVINFPYPMFVNLDILEACGIEEVPRTWSEFEEVCKTITENGYYAYAINLDASSPSGIQNVWSGFAWASDITMLNEEGKYSIAGNPDLAEYAEFMKNLNDQGYIYPGMSSLTETDMTSKFASGELAFIINSAAVLTSFRQEAPDLNIGVCAIPVRDGFEGTSKNCTANWALGITENSENKEEALKFIEYLYNADINADLAVTQSAIPGSTLAEPDYSGGDPVFPDIYEMYMAGTPYNEFTGMKSANEFMPAYIDEVVTYMDGDTDTETFLQNVQEIRDGLDAE